MRGDEDVNGQNEFLANCAADGVASFGPVVKGLEDDEKVYVAVGAGVAARVASEEDDLLWVEFLGDQLGDGLNCRSVD